MPVPAMTLEHGGRLVEQDDIRPATESHDDALLFTGQGLRSNEMPSPLV
jgi:hypothetical protein